MNAKLEKNSAMSYENVNTCVISLLARYNKIVSSPFHESFSRQAEPSRSHQFQAKQTCVETFLTRQYLEIWLIKKPKKGQ